MIDLKKILKEKKVIAVVGASDNTEKYGFKIFADLLNKGFNVYPVNVHKKEVLGHESFKDLKELSSFLSKKGERIYIIDLVIPPDKTFSVLGDAVELGIRKIWFQPGSESNAALEFCINNQIDYVANSCMMTESNDLSFKL